MIRAFLLGIVEFRQAWTTHTNHENAYDRGRELAHRLTLRKWEE